MRPPAPAPAAEGAPAAPPPPPEAQRAVPTPFLTKTYQLVDDPSLDDVISWNDGGSAFVVWHTAKFAGEVLPNYFKHNNFSSFVRQLNTYGFRKIASDRWEFAHECFRRGEKRLLCDIHRRKISSAPSSRVGSPSISGDEKIASTNTSPGRAQPAEAPGSVGKASELAEENERLRQENTHLSRELCKMKGLCNDIVKLMSKYSPCRRNSGGGEGGPSADEERAEGSSSGREGPRIFGVSIGPKRNRGEDGGAVPCEAGDVGRWPVAGNVTGNGKTLMEKNQDVRHHSF